MPDSNLRLPIASPVRPRCTWRRCRTHATHSVTAGTPGGPDNYATTYACDQHLQQVTGRTRRVADWQPATVEPLDGRT